MFVIVRRDAGLATIAAVNLRSQEVKMLRPYLKESIEVLEQRFADAARTINEIGHELKFRTTDRARALEKDCRPYLKVERAAKKKRRRIDKKTRRDRWIIQL